ncbi:hypothetical protein PIB30_094195, partial [Stylosanthes scabra]|nr:hypothetical protein [Stylosanthes scabra]
IPAIPNDTLIPQEPPIVAEAMVRIKEPRAKNPRQTRQTTPPQQPQVQHQQELPAGFYTHFDTANTKSTENLTNIKKRIGGASRPSTQGWTKWMIN